MGKAETDYKIGTLHLMCYQEIVRQGYVSLTNLALKIAYQQRSPDKYLTVTKDGAYRVKPNFKKTIERCCNALFENDSVDRVYESKDGVVVNIEDIPSKERINSEVYYRLSNSEAYIKGINKLNDMGVLVFPSSKGIEWKVQAIEGKERTRKKGKVALMIINDYKWGQYLLTDIDEVPLEFVFLFSFKGHDKDPRKYNRGKRSQVIYLENSSYDYRDEEDSEVIFKVDKNLCVSFRNNSKKDIKIESDFDDDYLEIVPPGFNLDQLENLMPIYFELAGYVIVFDALK